MSDNKDRLTVGNALAALKNNSEPFKTLFEHGSLVVEIYKPLDEDLQQAHTRDELYVIASGSGEFFNAGVQHSVEVGEVLFVPAGIEHRFVNFTKDFSTWVFFYGPENGELA